MQVKYFTTVFSLNEWLAEKGEFIVIDDHEVIIVNNEVHFVIWYHEMAGPE